MTMREFTIERTFDAPRELVWRAFTDPAIATQWYHPHNLISPADRMSFDVREGGEYRYVMIASDGTEYPTGGRYLAVTEPEHLRFTWAEPGASADESPVIDVRLTATADGRTVMSFRLSRLDDTRAEADNVHTGWSQALDNLSATVKGLQ